MKNFYNEAGYTYPKNVYIYIKDMYTTNVFDKLIDMEVVDEDHIHGMEYALCTIELQPIDLIVFTSFFKERMTVIEIKEYYSLKSTTDVRKRIDNVIKSLSHPSRSMYMYKGYKYMEQKIREDKKYQEYKDQQEKINPLVTNIFKARISNVLLKNNCKRCYDIKNELLTDYAGVLAWRGLGAEGVRTIVRKLDEIYPGFWEELEVRNSEK